MTSVTTASVPHGHVSSTGVISIWACPTTSVLQCIFSYLSMRDPHHVRVNRYWHRASRHAAASPSTIIVTPQMNESMTRRVMATYRPSSLYFRRGVRKAEWRLLTRVFGSPTNGDDGNDDNGEDDDIKDLLAVTSSVGSGYGTLRALSIASGQQSRDHDEYGRAIRYTDRIRQLLTCGYDGHGGGVTTLTSLQIYLPVIDGPRTQLATAPLRYDEARLQLMKAIAVYPPSLISLSLDGFDLYQCYLPYQLRWLSLDNQVFDDKGLCDMLVRTPNITHFRYGRSISMIMYRYMARYWRHLYELSVTSIMDTTFGGTTDELSYVPPPTITLAQCVMDAITNASSHMFPQLRIITVGHMSSVALFRDIMAITPWLTELRCCGMSFPTHDRTRSLLMQTFGTTSNNTKHDGETKTPTSSSSSRVSGAPLTTLALYNSPMDASSCSTIMTLWPRTITDLSLSPHQALTPYGLASLANHFTSLHSLTLTTDVMLKNGPTAVTADDIRALAPITHLSHLTADFAGNCHEAMTLLVSQWSHSLTSLNTTIPYSRITVASRNEPLGASHPLISTLPLLTQLRRLVIWGAITNDHLTIIGNHCVVASSSSSPSSGAPSTGLSYFKFAYNAYEHELTRLERLMAAGVTIVRYSRGYICRQCMSQMTDRCACRHWSYDSYHDDQ